MRRVDRPKRMVTKIGIGGCIIIPVMALLSILFAELRMNSILSIFLTVLISGIICLVYVIIYTKIEDKRDKKWEGTSDPFNHE